MSLVSVVRHVVYVNIMTPATLGVVVFAGTLLHLLVLSGTGSAYDSSTMGCVVLLACVIGWHRENNTDWTLGVSDSTASGALLTGVVLVVISEVALFVTLLWAVILYLAVLPTGTTSAATTIGHNHLLQCTVLHGCIYQNTLTLANTVLLTYSGIWSVIMCHGISIMSTGITLSGLWNTILLGVTFLGIQCCEYLHLYWCIFSAGSGMVFYTTTGIHGSHVLVGTAMLLMYWGSMYSGSVYTQWDACCSAGILGICLYWHFVDVVWLFVVWCVYMATLAM
nr:cytochrome c oxidase subunit 3 [Artemidia motanka]